MQNEITALQTQVNNLPTGGGLINQTLTWTNAALKAGTGLAFGTAAPNTIIIPVCMAFQLNYGGTSAFTSEPSVKPEYGGVAYGGNISVASFWESTETSMALCQFTAGFTATTIPSTWINVQPILTLSAGITGNAAGDNTVTIYMTYLVLSV